MIESTTSIPFRRANEQVGYALACAGRSSWQYTHSQPVPTKTNRNTHSGSA
jgi:hypothetical protein